MRRHGARPGLRRAGAVWKRSTRSTQWHTTALCSPTRSCLLTGRNRTRNSMACITEAASGFPNASGVIPPENGQLQPILGAGGWNTYMVGKGHLCPEAEMNLASTRRNWPTGRGFERVYGFPWRRDQPVVSDLVYDSHSVDPPRSPAEGYHLTEELTDKALEFIEDAKALAPEKPFFLCYAPGACHAPHHAPKEWADRFKGRFDMGYEAMREQALARQKELAIVPPDTELPPLNRSARPRPAPAVAGSRSRRSSSSARGTRCRRRSGGCSAVWRRSTQAFWPTPTIRSARRRSRSCRGLGQLISMHPPTESMRSWTPVRPARSRHGSVLEAAPGLVHTERRLGCLASQPTVTEAPGPGCLPAFWTGSRQQT
jgi:hypothetical protein